MLAATINSGSVARVSLGILGAGRPGTRVIPGLVGARATFASKSKQFKNPNKPQARTFEIPSAAPANPLAKKDELFLDQDPDVFRSVLNFLRQGHFQPPHNVPKNVLLRELSYYGFKQPERIVSNTFELPKKLGEFSSGERVRVNVGGQNFETLRDTVVRQPDTLLARYFAPGNAKSWEELQKPAPTASQPAKKAAEKNEPVREVVSEWEAAFNRKSAQHAKDISQLITAAASKGYFRFEQDHISCNTTPPDANVRRGLATGYYTLTSLAHLDHKFLQQLANPAIIRLTPELRNNIAALVQNESGVYVKFLVNNVKAGEESSPVVTSVADWSKVPEPKGSDWGLFGKAMPDVPAAVRLAEEVTKNRVNAFADHILIPELLRARNAGLASVNYFVGPVGCPNPLGDASEELCERLDVNALALEASKRQGAKDRFLNMTNAEEYSFWIQHVPATVTGNAEFSEDVPYDAKLRSQCLEQRVQSKTGAKVEYWVHRVRDKKDSPVDQHIPVFHVSFI